ncbi:MAG: beta-lactamase family protein [Candidatus Heimdallarchaeota archaeon]|nr:beta-lactamase family protein [Candidatus Heimdallarchaeota archaeon]
MSTDTTQDFSRSESLPRISPNDQLDFRTNFDVTDISQIQSFFDQTIANYRTLHNIPGITLSVVNSTNILHLNGYGYANIAENTFVNPNTTMFRAASVSKLFTWTAVMQLYEQGLLDLEEDVNTYLSEFKIPQKYDEPITMLHLMSHSAGFDQPSYYRNIALSLDDLLPLEEFLKKYMPSLVRAPGEFTTYSNYGAALAGYIVSEISGLPFEDYIEKNIFEPLGMNFSTFRQPIPDDIIDEIVTGYLMTEEGVLEPQEFVNVALAPAGTISISAYDAAQFMMAHLNNGTLDGTSILNETTTQFMHQQHFTNDPRLPGFAHGFIEYYTHGYRIIEHGGDISFSQSQLILLPSENIGYFINYNANIFPLRSYLFEDFMNTFFPGDTVNTLSPSANFKEEGKRFSGRYYNTRSDYTTFLHIAHFTDFVEVAITTDGYLLYMGNRYVQIDDLLFRAYNFDHKIAFREDDKGRITHIFIGATYVLERQTGLTSLPISISVLSISLGMLLITLIYPLIRNFIQKRKYKEEYKLSRLEKTTRILAYSTNIAFITYFLIFTPLMTTFYSSDELLYLMNGLTIIPMILLLPLIGLVVLVILMMKNRELRLESGIIYSLQILSTSIFFWWLFFWNWAAFPF